MFSSMRPFYGSLLVKISGFINLFVQSTQFGGLILIVIYR